MCSFNFVFYANSSKTFTTTEYQQDYLIFHCACLKLAKAASHWKPGDTGFAPTNCWTRFWTTYWQDKHLWGTYSNPHNLNPGPSEVGSSYLSPHLCSTFNENLEESWETFLPLQTAWKRVSTQNVTYPPSSEMLPDLVSYSSSLCPCFFILERAICNFWAVLRIPN